MFSHGPWSFEELELEKGNKHPHNEAHGPNTQAGGVSEKSFRGVMSHWGEVDSSKPSNLQHYPDHHLSHPDHETKVDTHQKKSGYQVYYAGGKHGKPDLENKNYTTGHLMVYDPSSGSGGDFKNEAYTRNWRKVHEQAHADTLSEVNKIYGEGRRMGKLGTHRSAREMKRAIHWEWLAAHKQRELHAQHGVHISDEDFHKELNTVIADATHRAITGKFTEPSEMGFKPHGKKIPLEHALGMIDQHAKEMGLRHDDDTFAARRKAMGNIRIGKPEGPTKSVEKSQLLNLALDMLKKGEITDPTLVTKIELGDPNQMIDFLKSKRKVTPERARWNDNAAFHHHVKHAAHHSVNTKNRQAEDDHTSMARWYAEKLNIAEKQVPKYIEDRRQYLQRGGRSAVVSDTDKYVSHPWDSGLDSPS